MEINPKDLPAPNFYRLLTTLIVPRPIAWVSTLSPRGIPNLAPFSFFNGVSSFPPTLLFSPVNNREGKKKDTVLNIEANGEFVVNIVPFSLAQQMNDTGAEYAYEESEFEKEKLTPGASTQVRVPFVQESPARIECNLRQLIPIGEGPFASNLVIGNILHIHIDDKILNEKGHVDPIKLDAIGRMGGSSYLRTGPLFELPPAQKKT